MVLSKLIAARCGSLSYRSWNTLLKLSPALTTKNSTELRACLRLSRTFSCSAKAQEKAYDEAFRKSLENPDDFWGEHAEKLVWTKKWDKVLDNSNPPFTKWYECMQFAN